MTRDEADAWAGIGVMDLNGRPSCTGALIAPDRVLTAAHCVYTNGRLRPPGQIRFRAGVFAGVARDAADVVRVVANRDWDPLARFSSGAVPTDVAILVLERPLSGPVYARNDTARPGREAVFVNYAGGRWNTPLLRTGCPIDRREGGLVAFDCPGRPGMSGAPIFTFDRGAPQIVSLVSGGRPGLAPTYGVAFDLALRRIEVDMAHTGTTSAAPWDSGPVAPSATPQAAAPTTGARRIVVGEGTGLGTQQQGSGIVFQRP